MPAHADEGKLVIEKMRRHIDAWLRGTSYDPGPRHDLASFGRLNTWYYADAQGCGICAAECPCGAIAMVPEQP